jgi:hypothetical protein
VTFLVPLIMFGWPLVVVALFSAMRPSNATAYAYAIGWCFLPNASYQLPGFPDYSKTLASTIGVVLGLAIFAPQSLLRFRPSLLDIPAFVFCLTSFFSSVANGLGPYDGLSTVVSRCMMWGVPYLIGRCAYTNTMELFDLARAIIICGLVYVPLCLWEVRMSPQLHYKFYGFQQHQFAQTRRWGGWRPTVFMQHGLQVALWMCSCLILCFGQWRIGRIQKLHGIPMTLVFTALGVTFLLLKSTGAYALALLGFVTLLLVRRQRVSWPLLAIPLLVVFYLAGRTSEVYTGRGIEDFTREYVGEARADSLKTRLDNEDRLIAKAKEQWLFGWGGWGRNRIYNDDGKDITITDGLWIITFGQNGLLGLISLYAMLLAGPVAVACFPAPVWRALTPLDTANLAGLTIVCSLAALDSLPNAVLLPIFTVVVGALTTIAARRKTERPLQARIVA